MTGMAAARAALRTRLLLARFGAVGVIAAVLLACCAGAIVWLVQATRLTTQRRELAAHAAALPRPALQAAAPAREDNSVQFYRALGERRYEAEQLRTLFAIASKAGLVLSRGEYREAFDANANLWTYQVTLPVKGGYGAIWDFALQSLKAIPFASLDEIGFHRETVGDASVEARLRFTLYLRDQPAGDAR